MPANTMMQQHGMQQDARILLTLGFQRTLSAAPIKHCPDKNA
jgi:hypothetical protein